MLSSVKAYFKPHRQRPKVGFISAVQHCNAQVTKLSSLGIRRQYWLRHVSEQWVTLHNDIVIQNWEYPGNGTRTELLHNPCSFHLCTKLQLQVGLLRSSSKQSSCTYIHLECVCQFTRLLVWVHVVVEQISVV